MAFRFDRIGDDVVTGDAHLAVAGRMNPRQRAKGGRFPRAVRTDQSENMTGVGGERELADGNECVVALRQVDDFDGWHKFRFRARRTEG